MLITKRIAGIFKCLDALCYWAVIYFLLVNECKNTVNPLGTLAIGNMDSYFFHGYFALDGCLLIE